jgi:F-type H+-transporting ATPase subunit gamma
MPSLIDLRRRVRAVKNTQQITKAMKMVAASKLRRAQERMANARPYAAQMQRVLTSVAARVDSSAHPLLTAREPRQDARTLVIIVTGDKGLCGSFNTNVIKGGATFILESEQACVLGLVGRKGRDYFARRGFPVMFEEVGLFQKLKYQDAQAIAAKAIAAFTGGEVDRVVLVYNEFKSMISQKLVVSQLLPIPRAEVDDQAAVTSALPGEGFAAVDYLYEPSPAQIFDQLLPRYVEVQVYRSLLESNAAFFAAQMTAMDTATKNSSDMIASLTLYMNKVRQAAITREIIEVVSGAGALS